MTIRVGVFPADHGGCGSYRLRWPWAEVGKQFSESITVIDGDDVQDQILLAWEGGPFDEYPTEYHVPISILHIPDVDVMVFQRPLQAKYVPYFKLLRERGVLIIVDLDDNFDRIDPRNVAWFTSEPHWMTPHEAQQIAKLKGNVRVTKKTSDGLHLYAPGHMGATHRRNIHAALREVDLLITSTPALAAHYGGIARQTMVLPNCVNESYLELAQQVDSDEPIVGWTGSVMTHPQDLQEMGNALAFLRAKNVPFIWHVVGTGDGVAARAGLEPDTVTDGWVSLEDYPREYAKMHVAVCPLDLSQFNEAKSWLKPLEAAALGVVPVMSPTPEYTRLHNMGVGLITDKPKWWERHLRTLITNSTYRNEIRESGLEVARELTYQKQAYRWAEALNAVLVGREAHAAG